MLAYANAQDFDGKKIAAALTRKNIPPAPRLADGHPDLGNAAGSWEPAAIRRGWHAVRRLQQQMDEGRRRRLAYIGFPDGEAAELSALHTRNFM